jgi:ABC-2 type transport system ATP-binding protein
VEPLIAVDALVKRYGARVALAGVTFTVDSGAMFGVIGPDGAGKTTLLRLLCGLLAPDAGTVRLRHADPFRDRIVATSVIGYLSQRFSLYGDLSIDENIDFFGRVHRVPNFDARRDRLLALTGLTPFRTRLAARLSGGMKQKLALACTLIHEPPLLILDEPTTGVDPVSRREFWKLLAEFVGQGLTVVLATPYLDEAERCDRVALLGSGRLLALDAPARLQESIAGVTLEVIATPVRLALTAARAAIGSDRVQLFGDRLHVRVDTDAAATSLAGQLRDAGVLVASLRAIKPSLEDVFIDLTAATRGKS